MNFTHLIEYLAEIEDKTRRNTKKNKKTYALTCH